MSFFFFFYQQFLLGISTQCFGILFLGFLTELKTSSTVIGWMYSLAFVFSSFFTYFLEPLVNKYGWRVVAFALGLANSLGLALSSFATSAAFLFFSYSFVAGNTQCCSYIIMKTPKRKHILFQLIELKL